jgi:hypothetical protein
VLTAQQPTQPTTSVNTHGLLCGVRCSPHLSRSCRALSLFLPSTLCSASNAKLIWGGDLQKSLYTSHWTDSRPSTSNAQYSPQWIRRRRRSLIPLALLLRHRDVFLHVRLLRLWGGQPVPPGRRTLKGSGGNCVGDQEWNAQRGSWAINCRSSLLNVLKGMLQSGSSANYHACRT